jgi:outer membrane beta-barrel protein
MKKSCVGLLVAAALGILPANSWAQAKGNAAAGETAEGAAAGEAAPAEGGEGTPAEGEGTESPEGGGLEEICKIDPAACPNLDMEKEAARPLRESIYAMQQIFALRARRLELMPYFGITLNDQFVGHNGPGLGINYYITNVLAIGVNGNFYDGFNQDQGFNAQVRRAARVAVPLTEYQWSAALNLSYVPAYGKFAGFGDFIFHYDAYIVGGVGAISTRPIAVIDPDNRNFQFEPKIAFNAGFGFRVFVNRWFAIDAEVRDYVYPEKLESLSIDQTGKADKSTWYQKNTSLTNAVQAQVGLSIFLPFSFEYRLPK